MPTMGRINKGMKPQPKMRNVSNMLNLVKMDVHPSPRTRIVHSITKTSVKNFSRNSKISALANRSICESCNANKNEFRRINAPPNSSNRSEPAMRAI